MVSSQGQFSNFDLQPKTKFKGLNAEKMLRNTVGRYRYSVGYCIHINNYQSISFMPVEPSLKENNTVILIIIIIVSQISLSLSPKKKVHT